MSCFYEKGLQFECTGCNYCCSCEPGFVFLSPKDLKRVSSHLGISEEVCITTYCRTVPMGNFGMISLQEKKNYDCIFLTEKGCSVYKGRPEQCRTYPFWSSIVEDKAAWEAEMASCPGMGKGRLYTKEEIEKLLENRTSNQPIMKF
ncbi:MAG: YkgJ family cysteine cluster protein [Sphaerochaeta sp.]|nr:YkgJ family cysteine cluster protein [Sphaerochaeta sp.]